MGRLIGTSLRRGLHTGRELGRASCSSGAGESQGAQGGPGDSSGGWMPRQPSPEAWPPVLMYRTAPLSLKPETLFCSRRVTDRFCPRPWSPQECIFCSRHSDCLFSGCELERAVSPLLSLGGLGTQAHISSHLQTQKPCSSLGGHPRVWCPHGPGLPKAVVYVTSVWGSFMHVSMHSIIDT